MASEQTIEPYYFALGEGHYRSTIHAQGAWNPHEQHMAPVSGILTHCIERYQPQDGFRTARLSFEILGLIPDGEFEVVTTMLRPGRTIELVQAELVSGGRTAVRARAWRLQTSDTSAVAAIEDAPMAGPSHASGPVSLDDWPGGYIHSIEIRAVPGTGRAAARPGPHPASAGRRCAVPRLRAADRPGRHQQRHRHPGAPGRGQLPVPQRRPAGAPLPGADGGVAWAGELRQLRRGRDRAHLHGAARPHRPFGRAEQILTLRKA